MEPMTMGLLAGGAALANIGGGIMGANAAAGNRAAAEAAIRNAMAQYDGIDIPDIQKMQLAYEEIQQQGIFSPEMLQEIALGSTALENIKVDPRYKEVQLKALDRMSKMGETGLTAEDTAALNKLRRTVAGDAKAKDQSILQNLASRGVGGSGMELATRLASSEASADRASQESDAIAAMAQQRMLQSAAQGAQMAGSMRGQEYGEQANLAQARDAIANFNTRQKADIQAANVNARNQAQAMNLTNKQRIHETNVNQRNAQQQYNKQLLQQKFSNQMALAGGRAGMGVNLSNFLSNQGNQIAQGYANIGAGIGQAISGAGSMYNAAEANKLYNERTKKMEG